MTADDTKPIYDAVAIQMHNFITFYLLLLDASHTNLSIIVFVIFFFHQ